MGMLPSVFSRDSSAQEKDAAAREPEEDPGMHGWAGQTKAMEFYVQKDTVRWLLKFSMHVIFSPEGESLSRPVVICTFNKTKFTKSRVHRGVGKQKKRRLILLVNLEP